MGAASSWWRRPVGRRRLVSVPYFVCARSTPAVEVVVRNSAPTSSCRTPVRARHVAGGADAPALPYTRIVRRRRLPHRRRAEAHAGRTRLQPPRRDGAAMSAPRRAGWRRWPPPLPTAAPAAASASRSARRRANRASTPLQATTRVGELSGADDAIGGRRRPTVPAEVAQRLRRQRTLQRRPVPRASTSASGPRTHRQDAGARGGAAARGRAPPAPPTASATWRRRCTSAARQHAASLGDAEEILAPAERRTAEVLFYTGCNVLRTPHIVLNVMDILDALELDFDVVGGTAHCCGVLSIPGSRPADLRAHGLIAPSSARRVGRRQRSDLVPDLHQESSTSWRGDVEPAVASTSAISASSCAANLEALRGALRRRTSPGAA